MPCVIRIASARISGQTEPHAVLSDRKSLYHKERRLKGSMRENGFRAIGGLAQRLTSGLARGRGKGRASVARLRAEWTAIVGAELARLTQPEALLAGRGAARLLRLKVESAAALEIQHRSAQIVE